MNTYNENLQQTVVNTLSALCQQQANLASAETVAEYTLYHAQGAEITARDKLNETDGEITAWQNITDQSLLNENQVFNLLASATEANADVAASITNTATAASNVQIASNAISALASDIGAALNIATASLFDTDVYKRIVNANGFINEVANEAKKIAKDAMNASGLTSEITTTEVLAQTSSLKANIDNLFKSTQAELDKFANLAIAENKSLSQASQAERQAEGALKDAQREVAAIDTAYGNANNQLNQMLVVDVDSMTEIAVSFAALPSPFPRFFSPDASKIAIPEAVSNYYLTLLPTQSQTTFSLDQAEQLFAQRPDGDKNQFHPVSPDAHTDPKTSEIVRSPTKITLTTDVYGNAIEPGSSYVGFLYIELTQAYKQYISNFADMLSAPTQSFVPATTLPSPLELTCSPPDRHGGGCATAQFQVTLPHLEDGEANDIAFRCILIEADLMPNPDYLCSDEEAAQPPIFFNLAIAEQISPANYTAAEPSHPVGNGCSNVTYDLVFDATTTDNFGDRIKPGVGYVPLILSVAGGVSAARFVNALSKPLDAFVVCA